MENSIASKLKKLDNRAKAWLSVGMAVLGMLLFANGMGNCWTGIAKLKGPENLISPEDLKTYREVSALPPAPLLSLQKNLDQIALFASNGDVTIDGGKDGGSRQKDSKEADKINKDRLGFYKEIRLNLKGDFFDQLYFLNDLNSRCRRFLLVKQVKGDDKGVEIEARAYGGK